MRNPWPCILIGLISLGCLKKPIPPDRLDLTENWKLSGENQIQDLSARVPGSIHSTLLKHAIIADPFADQNADSSSWVSEKSWTYNCDFELPKSWLDYQNIDLVFEGIDTYSEIFLNDSLIAISENMFVPIEVSVKDLLKKGKNSLILKVKDPVSEAQERYLNWPFKFPAENDRGKWKASPFVRKAAYHFGWDWAPRILSAGIHKPVFLRAWNGGRLNDVQIYKGDKDWGSARCELEVLVTESGSFTLGLSGQGIETITTEVKLRKGKNKVNLDLRIPEPRLWWPSGMGRQNLYQVKVNLFHNMRLIDSLKASFGLRNAELKREIDSIGESFFFEINGKRIFAKGGNYVPLDILLDRVSKEDYKKLIGKVKAANFNMLRVWGGGIYEADEFYQLCDQEGIMVWQDFMFANALYPWDSTFQKNIGREVGFQVKRLRNHPSIVLWCGNNEIETAWKNWAWVKEMGIGPEDSSMIWGKYQFQFDSLIPGIINKYDPERSYLSSSPSSNWAGEENFKRGNIHDWSVWHGEQSIKIWTDRAPRFNSEYGMQSYPSLTLLNNYSTDSIEMNGEYLKYRQKANRGNERLTKYILDQYRKPKGLEHLIFISQSHQAMAVGEAAEYLRISQPWCMGSLVWQVNDSWPGISWSILDYGLQEKPLYHSLKKAYDPILINSIQKSRRLQIRVLNGSKDPFQGNAIISRLNFFGRTLSVDSAMVEVDPAKSQILFDGYIGAYLDSGVSRWTFFQTKIFDRNGIIHEDIHFLVKPRSLWLKDARVKAHINRRDKDFQIILSSEFLAKDLWLESKNIKGSFSNNHFDLIPGLAKEVIFIPDIMDKKRSLNLKMVSLNDFR
jgi:beta-mannosidase